MTPRRAEPDIRLLADDLTGALDSAAAFASGVPVYLDEAPKASTGGVVAVATPTRDVPAEELPPRLKSVLDWFVSGGLAFKKVDSLLRGNTFAECAHLARAGGFDGVVFAPAFPGQRRVTVGGQQYVVTTDAAAMTRRDPVGPSIVDAFAALGLECRTSASLDMLNGRDAGLSKGTAPTVWVPDVHTNADLLALARLASSPSSPSSGRWLWCGSAGLAQAFAATTDLEAAAVDAGLAPDLAPSAAPSPSQAPVQGGSHLARHLLMLGASHHPVVRRQWVRLREAWPTAVVVREGDEGEFEAACGALEHPFDVAALELSPRRPLTPGQAADLLEAQLAELVRRTAKPSTLLVIGGDTLLGLCRATGVESLRTQPASRPGWGCASLVGGRWDGLTCHSRSGAFGDESDLAGMLQSASRP